MGFACGHPIALFSSLWSCQAHMVMNQFHVTDRMTRQQFYYLHLLEPEPPCKQNPPAQGSQGNLSKQLKIKTAHLDFGDLFFIYIYFFYFFVISNFSFLVFQREWPVSLHHQYVLLFKAKQTNKVITDENSNRRLRMSQICQMSQLI